MVSGHPLLTGLIQVTLTTQSTVSVSMFVMLGGNGASVRGLKKKKSYFIAEKNHFKTTRFKKIKVISLLISKRRTLRPMPICIHKPEKMVPDILWVAWYISIFFFFTRQ